MYLAHLSAAFKLLGEFPEILIGWQYFIPTENRPTLWPLSSTKHYKDFIELHNLLSSKSTCISNTNYSFWKNTVSVSQFYFYCPAGSFWKEKKKFIEKQYIKFSSRRTQFLRQFYSLNSKSKQLLSFECIMLRNSVDIVSSGSTIFHGLIWKDLAELLQQMSSKFSVWVDLSFDLFIFIQGLFHAIFCIQLRVSPFINVSSEQQKNNLFSCTMPF